MYGQTLHVWSQVRMGLLIHRLNILGIAAANPNRIEQQCTCEHGDVTRK